ncbi:hypothetical protein DNTS_014052 [Danionella cerebrum]|uniref:Uncharacterized protein n=1 Tax=Danionella cerebrum TaxID=2873325 RepID=A0A553NIK5_9TELE|nr:hypothetical protein DNTS_014052 [Danionella translucida]
MAFCLVFIFGQESSRDQPASEVKYALIGAGIGLLLSFGFILVKLHLIRKQVLDTEASGLQMRRTEGIEVISEDD